MAREDFYPRPGSGTTARQSVWSGSSRFFQQFHLSTMAALLMSISCGDSHPGVRRFPLSVLPIEADSSYRRHEDLPLLPVRRLRRSLDGDESTRFCTQTHTAARGFAPPAYSLAENPPRATYRTRGGCVPSWNSRPSSIPDQQPTKWLIAVYLIVSGGLVINLRVCPYAERSEAEGLNGISIISRHK